MLEKIGLPPKPSLRGSSWVVDASHCQGCSSQFTFLNRKHHCRRCGGLFCNSCTQQRMVLRGQGDSPVRICDPCKKLEEAARFEMRYGHKNRAVKGDSSKIGPKHEDTLLNEILGIDGKRPFSSARQSHTDAVSDLQRAVSSASCSNLQEEALSIDVEVDAFRAISHENEIGSNSPEELRQQALEEKQKYRVLKGEGKSEEALRAFKRGKELERQAAAVEIALRKSRRKALTLNSSTSSEETTEESLEVRQKNKPAARRGKGEKDDLAAELRELGWSDADLQDGNKKPGKASLEGELSNLLGEISQDPARDRKTGNLDKTQVTMLKKKALMLKREGKLAEAKEELKRAKLMEKQIEEQELFAGSEDSDDELSALIRSMDDSNYQHDDSLLDYSHDQGFNKEIFVDFSADNAFDGVDVTDAEMNDPEIAAALKSFGWAEDAVNSDDDIPESVPKNVNALQKEVLIMKREALNWKRSGNVTEAMAHLKKAKLIEKEIEDLQSQGHSSALENILPTNSKQKPSTSFTTEVISLSMEDHNQRPPLKSKLAIQKELLSLKKKALALRREGRLEEAEEELKKGSVLEHQLQEMENALGVVTARSNISRKDIEPAPLHKHPHVAQSLALEDEEEPDVTEKDMNDPTMLSVLKNLGWEDEDDESGSLLNKVVKPTNRDSVSTTTMISTSMEDHNQRPPIKSKLAIQRELLGLKKKALALRREGQLEEAEEELKKGKVLERQLEEMENAPEVIPSRPNVSKKDVESAPAHKHADAAKSLAFEEEEPDVTEKDMNDPALLSVLKNLGWEDEGNESGSLSSKAMKLTGGDTGKAEAPGRTRRSKAEIQREILGFKRKALGLRRQGKPEEAEEELTKAKALEEQLAEMEAQEKELLHRPKSKESENLGSLVLEKHGGVEHGIGLPLYIEGLSFNSADDPVGEVSDGYTKDSQLPKALEDLDWKNDDKHPLIAKAGPVTEAGQTKQMGIPHQPKEVANPMDLLTGELSSNLLPTGKLFGDGNSDVSTPFSGLQHHPEVCASLAEKKDSNGIPSGLVPNHVVQMGDKTVPAGSTSTHRVNPPAGASSGWTSLQQEVLAHKRKALALKREGKLAEAREELRQAKLLEKSLGENHNQSDIGHTSVTVSSFERIPAVQENKTNHASKPLSGRDRFKLQQESLAHKRQALKLRREGRISESEAEFELAKALETQLEELGGHESDNYKSKGEATDDIVVDDLLDPQLLSSLKAIGWQEADIVGQVPKKSEVKPAIIEGKNTAQEKGQLEERIKAEKLRALNLKREGKQGEALDALRQAKLLEKKLNSLA